VFAGGDDYELAFTAPAERRAAVQAAAILGGEDLGAVAARWGTNRGTLLDAVPRDDERLTRIAALRTAVVETPALAGTGR